MKVIRERFDVLDGNEITSFRLFNDNGVEITVIDYGCIITNIIVPDKKGKKESIVLGFDKIQDYIDYSPLFGSVVGRFAGRIKEGKFSLDGKGYELIKNNGSNHIHGGSVGFDKAIWKAEVIENPHEVGVVFEHFSADGEESYPGNVNVKLKYTLNNRNEFSLVYEGTTDKKTILCLTNHTYFNLSGNLKNDIRNHELVLKSERFVELDEELIPTGKIIPVDGTVFDFRGGRKIGDGVVSEDEQNVIAGNGYDHPFVLSENGSNEIILKDDLSGRALVVETNQPSVVLYTGTQIADDFEIRGTKSRKYLGLCLETQGFPDAINQPEFPSCVLNVGEIYNAYTKWTFGFEEKN